MTLLKRKLPAAAAAAALNWIKQTGRQKLKRTTGRTRNIARDSTLASQCGCESGKVKYKLHLGCAPSLRLS